VKETEVTVGDRRGKGRLGAIAYFNPFSWMVRRGYNPGTVWRGVLITAEREGGQFNP